MTVALGRLRSRAFAPILTLALAGAVLGSAVACSDADNGSDGGATPAPVQRIVYEARGVDDTIVNVYTIDPATKESTQLTNGSSFDGNPGWSPDYSRIIFASDRERGDRQNDIYTMAADGSDVRKLTDGRIESFWSPKFSPDGRLVTFAWQEGEYYIGLMRSDGQDARRIAGPYDFAEFPAWTRDGAEVYFTAISPQTQAADILAVDLETTDVRTVISTPDADVCPHFSRDGTLLTYASTPKEGDSDEPEIFAHDLSSDDTTGADDRPLTSHEARDDYANPSPDGSEYVFVTSRGGSFDLYLMDADGSNARPLTQTPDSRENVPDW